MIAREEVRARIEVSLYCVGGCVLRLNAVALVFVGLASVTFPIHAEQKYTSQPELRLSGSSMHSPIRLPDFVPVLNYDQFLLASRGDSYGVDIELSVATRSAAEALSAKFAGPSDGAHLAVAPDPKDPDVLDASSDPKQLVKIAELTQSTDLIDPAKVARMAVHAEKQSEEISRSVVRNAERETRRARSSRSRGAKRSGSRRQHNRVASDDVPERTGSASTGISASVDRLIGFGTFAPDHRLTR